MVRVALAERQFQSYCYQMQSIEPHTSPPTEIAHFPPITHNILFYFTFYNRRVLHLLYFHYCIFRKILVVAGAQSDTLLIHIIILYKTVNGYFYT